MAMTAADVRASLMSKWSPSEYVHVNEAPQDAARQGRKIDVLIISMWASRGHELDAVEIKVSYSDWKRELENARKADWWWTHTHRFWIAGPAKLAERIQPELPTGWGLLSCPAEGAPTVVVKPTKHTPEQLPWKALIGIIRAACDAGPGALMRAEQRGRDQGYKEGKLVAERTNGDMFVRAQLEQLQEKVAAFAQASGIEIDGSFTWPEHLGRAVNVLAGYRGRPEMLLDRLDQATRSLTEVRAQLAEALTPRNEADSA
jgi:hypothetical protein